jgi:DNA-binding HxlR family transcriptional regulator
MQGGLCPRFHKAIELIGGRWTGAVLRLLMGGRARFAELRGSVSSKRRASSRAT